MVSNANNARYYHDKAAAAAAAEAEASFAEWKNLREQITAKYHVEDSTMCQPCVGDLKVLKKKMERRGSGDVVGGEGE
jgi:hypothetical protein